jgi:hypothetical protein
MNNHDGRGEGGLFVRRIFKAAAVVAATSLAGLGILGAAGGPADAATGQSVTGCDLSGSNLSGLGALGDAVSASVTPACSAGDSTVIDPTSLTVQVDPSFFTTLEAVPGLSEILETLEEPLAVQVSYTLSCSVNGQTVNSPGSFEATTTISTQAKAIDLQTAVGSPEPNSCTLTGLGATSLLSLNAQLLGLLNSDDFSFGVSATANTAAPGAIWQSSGKTRAGVNADICVDDTANGNGGSAVQAYQCNSDLAQYWTWTSDGELVRNGDCLTNADGRAELDQCTGGAAQQWTVHGTGGALGTVVSAADGKCLTTVSPLNGKQLAVAACSGKASQQWTGPQQAVS